jgi:hypothetical protein
MEGPGHGPRYLFLACAIIVHAVLGSHGGGGMQGGSIKGHTLHVGDVAGEVAQARAICLVWVPPVLEELLEEWGLTTLRKDRNLGRKQEEQDVAGRPSRGPRVSLRAPFIMRVGHPSPYSPTGPIPS